MAAASDTLSSSFQTAFLSSANQMGFSIVLLLAWLSTCDGEIHPDEVAEIRRIAAASKNPSDVDIALAIARTASPADLQLACEVVRHLPKSARHLFLQMTLGLAIEDKVIRPAENHVIRFIADTLELGANGLQETFIEMTGHAFPLPEDLSDPSRYSESRGTHSRHEGDSAKAGAGAGARAGAGASSSRERTRSGMSRIRALAILGLDDDASDEEIRGAYRRLAKIHHPDRFSTLGAEAVAAATATFQRIQSAYQFLAK